MGRYADALQRKLDALIERATKALILEIVRELKRATPVDTGHARANWIPSVGSENTAEAQDASLQAAGQAAVLSYKLGQGLLFITNVVPYIRRLNDGWSGQAPALFVESAVLKAMQTIRAKTNVDFGIQEYTSGVGAAGAENLASAFSPFAED